MKVLALFAAAVVAGGVVSLPAAATELKPRSGCDISVVFKPRKGKIDLSSYRRMRGWLENTKEISSFRDVETSGAGRKVCIVVPSRQQIRPVYTNVTLLVERSFGWDAPVQVVDRFGSVFRLRPVLSPVVPGRPPKNNGISERPTVGNRN